VASIDAAELPLTDELKPEASDHRLSVFASDRHRLESLSPRRSPYRIRGAYGRHPRSWPQPEPFAPFVAILRAFEQAARETTR